MKTFANGRSILHKGDNLTHTAAPPDVCKTPSPAGPVPIPYVNVAMDSSLASGTKKVKVEGKMAAHEKANISTSMGDEPGTAGGLLSSKFKGKLTWATSSPTVKLEGKGAVRFLDVAQHNGNSFNTAFISLGSPGLAYADDFEGLCDICDKSPDTHRVLTQESSIDLCVTIIEELVALADGMIGGSTAYGKRQFRDGFMVGVMVCKCGDTHAAMSGKRSTAFVDVATPIVTHVYTDTQATAAQLAGANAASTASYPHQLERIEERFGELQSRFEERAEGYNPPGKCAGPKLLASGHAPAEMTEMYFSSPTREAPWSASYSVLRTVDDHTAPGTPAWNQILQNMEARREMTEYGPGSESDAPEVPGVASCQTCQELLYLATCDIDDWSC